MLTREELLAAIPHALPEAVVPGLGQRRSGKVRDMYAVDGHRLILIATDRISAFDRVLGAIPHKGQVLNQVSAWWFERTRDIVPNHLVSVPDPNVTVARAAEPLPVEVVVRGYITGVTRTSLWTLYAQGERKPYGVPLPEGLRKNDPLPEPILTPTTKGGPTGHDERLTSAEVVERGLVEAGLWARVEEVARALFLRGQKLAREAGLILVDTKYELGLVEGELTLIDELHTPDSSRFWDAATCGGEADPVHYDKEYLRHRLAAAGYRGDGPPPELPEDLVVEVAQRYIDLYERLTRQAFVPAQQPALPRILRNLREVAAR